MTASTIREYDIGASSTSVFGRVLCNARNHHWVVDGPVQNGCPGEALTPPEVFLTGVAACAVELIQVIAREKSVGIGDVAVKLHGMLDRSRQSRTDVTLLNSVHLDIEIAGTDAATAAALVEGFKRR